ncbi:MAG: serine hydrolase domain-containing protein, partial [Candidatus Hodarchaeota archaeon]
GTISIFALLLLTFPCLAHATSTSGPTDSKELEVFLDKFFADQMEKLHIPGVGFALVKDGEIFFTKGYGFADLEKQTPVIPDRTLFRVASISKLFTATAIMQLYEQGKLNLDDDVNRYLNLFKLEANYSEPITFANLLTHTGGFDDRNIKLAVLSRSELLPLGQYLALRMPPRVMPPGDVTSYSNHGFALAGYLVEEISGTPFSEYIDKNILQPLKMKRTSFQLPPHLTADLAKGYVYKNGTYQAVPFEFLKGAPAYSLITTATDMAHFMIAHLQNGRFQNSHILKEATAQEMHRQHFTHHPKLPGFAYGFFESFENKQRSLEHSGDVRGFYSRLFLLPDHKLGFFVSSNNFGSGVEWKLLTELRKQFLDHYYPVTEKPTTPQPPADFEARADRFAGSYRFNRYARHTLDKYWVLSGKVHEVHVRTSGDGTLTVGRYGRYVEVEPLLFRRVNDHPYIAFREGNNNRITHMFIERWAYEKLPWYETKFFQRHLMGILALVFLSALIIWPVGYFIHRLRRHPSRTKRSPWVVQILAGLTSALNLVFMTGLALALPRDPLEIWCGVPSVVIALLAIPLLTTPLTGGLSIFTVLAWEKKYWGVLGRVHYSLITLAALSFIPVLLYWNWLGFKF